MSEPTRLCPGCKDVRGPLPLSRFTGFERSRGQVRPGRIQSYCLDCRREYDQRRNAERALANRLRAHQNAQTNPDAKLGAVQRRRERLALGPRLTPRQEAVLWRYYGHACLGCGEGERVQLDHVKSVAEGGLDEPDNVQPACPRCNRRKGKRPFDYRPVWYARECKAGRDPGPPPYPWPAYVPHTATPPITAEE